MYSDFSRISQNIPTPFYFASPLKGFPLELSTVVGSKNYNDGATKPRKKSLTISLAVWIQYTDVTNRRTDTRKQQRPRLCIASHGKKTMVGFSRVWHLVGVMHRTMMFTRSNKFMFLGVSIFWNYGHEWDGRTLWADGRLPLHICLFVCLLGV